MVTTKFNVTELTRYGNGGGVKVKLSPVMGNTEENKEFWKYTPSGSIEMYIDNPEAFKQFEDLGEFYVTFEKAE